MKVKINKKIAFSAASIMTVSALLVGVVYAIFSSTASVTGNTYATGILEIRVNGSPSVTGFNYTNAAPGDVATKSFTLQNYGPPWFAGPSTLAAKEILPSASKTSGDLSLYNALDARLYANAGWGGCSNPGVVFVPGKGCTVYNGPLSGLTGLSSQDILHATQWGTQASLAAGNSLSMILEVELPTSAGNSLQGKSTTFNLNMTAYNPHN